MANSKRSRNPYRTSRRNLPPFGWFLLLAGAAAIIVGLFLALRSPGTESVSGDAPKLAVDQEKIDFGDVHFNQPVTATFNLTNTGSGVLRLTDQPYIRVIEGCWPPNVVVGSTTLQPGQSTTLSMTFTMHEGMDGFHDFRVKIPTNDPAQPEKELVVLSNWIP